MKNQQLREKYELSESIYMSGYGLLRQDCENIAEQLYNEGYRKQEWISVEDRLPEDNETVLTIDTESVMEVCFYQTEWKGVFQRYGGLVKIFNITHWMPLPEAPKGE